MRRAQPLGLLLVLLLVFSAEAAHERKDYDYIVQSLKQTITASCSGEARPDLVIIVGGDNGQKSQASRS